MFLFSEAEVGLRHPFLLSDLLDGNQSKKRELTALPAICAIIGQPWQDRYKKHTVVFGYLHPVGHPWFYELPLRCQAWASVLASFLWGMYSCVCWVPFEVLWISMVGATLEFGHQDAEGCISDQGFCRACQFEVLAGPGSFILCSFRIVSPDASSHL